MGGRHDRPDRGPRGGEIESRSRKARACAATMGCRSIQRRHGKAKPCRRMSRRGGSIARRRSKPPKGERCSARRRSRRVWPGVRKTSGTSRTIRSPRGNAWRLFETIGSPPGHARGLVGAIGSRRGLASMSSRAIGSRRVRASACFGAIRSPPCSARSMFLSGNSRGGGGGVYAGRGGRGATGCVRGVRKPCGVRLLGESARHGRGSWFA